MDRRTFLAAATAGLSGLAGCLGGDPTIPGAGGSGTPAGTGTPTPGRTPDADPGDPDAADGYPPEFETTPEERSVDPDGFETVDRDGVAVPLAPIDVAHYWYRRGEARFADARGETQYDQSHVLGAVWSPAPDGRQSDPVDDWPTGDRIVAYCGCPHHLSSMRAASLIEAGFEEVYVVDEGFWEWHDRDYPMAGTEVDSQPRARVVRGRTDPSSAGESAWARHEPSGQREAAPIDADGHYRLELRFADVSDASPVVVETPDYAVEAPLGTLTGGIVTETT